MDFSLDEVESAFLNAVLAGVEASPSIGVARDPEDALAHHNTASVPEARHAAANPQPGAAPSVLHGGPVQPQTHSTGPFGESHRRDSPPASSPQFAPSPCLPLVLGSQQQLDASPGAKASETAAATANPSVDPRQQQQQLLQQTSPLPPQPPEPQRQQIHSHAAAAPPRPGAVSPVHAAATGRSGAAAKPPPAAPPACSRPDRSTPPRSAAPLSATPTSTTTTAGVTSPVARLPNSYSTGAISEVSVATTGSATSTASTSTHTPPRRGRAAVASTNPGAGLAATSSGGGSLGSPGPVTSSSSGRFSGTALSAAAVPGPGPGSAAGAAALLPSSSSSCRCARGLLQRIQSLEVQLTELLLADGDGDAADGWDGDGCGDGDCAAAGPGEQVEEQEQVEVDECARGLTTVCREPHHQSAAAAAFPDAAAAAAPLRPTDLNGHNRQQRHPHRRPEPQKQQQAQQPQGRRSATSNVGAGAAGGPAGAARCQRQQLVFAVSEQLCRDYNSSGVALMEAGLDEAAREQLAKALLLAGPGGPLEGSPGKQRELQIVAHNNLACYYRKFRQPALALEHLQHAARLETVASAGVGGASADGEDANGTAVAGSGSAASTATPAPGDPAACGGAADGAGAGGRRGPTAATLLNLAAVSSSLGQHSQALSYAARAVWAAAGELQVPLAPLESALLQGLPQAQLWEVLPQLRGGRACQGATTQLAMAYYNRAVEQEHLHQWHAALESYRLAVDVASRFVGRGDGLTLTMQQSAEAFKVRLRKLERQGKVRASRLASPEGAHHHPGAGAGGGSGGGGSGGSGGGPGLTPALPGSAAAAAMSGCVAAPPRPHLHLRPLLRCATAVTTTSTVAAAAAAAALAGLPSKDSRASALLPAIAPGRPASTPVGSNGFASPAYPATCYSPNDPRVTASAVAPRRAFSAGRAAPPARVAPSALGRSSAGHVPAALSHPMVSAPAAAAAATAATAAAAGEPPCRGSASHVPAVSQPVGAAAAASPAAAVMGGEAGRAQRRAGWSPLLPPRPPPEGSPSDPGRAGVGGGSSTSGGAGIGGGGGGGGGGAPEASQSPRWGLGSPGMVEPGSSRVVADGVERTPRAPTSRRTTGGATPAADAAGAADPWPSGRRSAGSIPAAASPPPPAPTPVAMTSAEATPAAAEAKGTAVAAVAPAAPPTTSGSPERHNWCSAETAGLGESGEASLAAVAAAAVAAAAELERICAAGEDWQAERPGPAPSLGRGPVQISGRAGRGSSAGGGRSSGGGWREDKGCASGRAPGSKYVPSPSAQVLPARVLPVGTGGGSARVADAWGAGDGALDGVIATVRSAAAPGGMLVPKRDGVAV